MAGSPQVRVWAAADRHLQHYAAAPQDQTSHEWTASTVCGLTASLRWIPNELVDTGLVCEPCVHALGTVTPPLESDHPGPP